MLLAFRKWQLVARLSAPLTALSGKQAAFARVAEQLLHFYGRLATLAVIKASPMPAGSNLCHL
jgi:hypothetical protein